MENIYNEVIRSLKMGRPLVIATIIDVAGSAPRSSGSKMIIREDGSIFATIGGGKLEAAAIDAAQTVYHRQRPHMFPFNLTKEDINSMGMICGGQGEVLMDWVTAEDLPAYEAAQKAFEQRQKGWMVIMLDQRQGGLTRQLGFISPSGEVAGHFETDILWRAQNAVGGNMMHTEEVEGLRFWIEPVHTGGLIYLFGGGHVAYEIARIAHMVEFSTAVLDDRAEFANKERFPHSHCMVLDSFEHLPDLPVDEDSYLIIVTRGHLHDQVCLEQALQTKAGYIGMIGSRRKKETIYQNLRDKGVSDEILNRVYSPIGLAIQAETPAEIAVSILAELIQVRARKHGA
jgi:xanthine dehydrogenase accessory factor